MKLQLSKVATIAIVAFIGIGFAGTQQAHASDCPKDNCGYFGTRACVGAEGGNACLQRSLWPVIKRSFVDKNSSCLDCDGLANGPNKTCTKHCVKFRTVYYDCDIFDVCTLVDDGHGNLVPEMAANGLEVYDKFVHQTSGECTVHGTCP